MDLPDEVFANLFQHLQISDYQAVAATTKAIRKIGQTTAKQLQLGSESVTAVYHGYHLSSYQHAMVKHLLHYKEDAQYRCVSDTHNLLVIAIILSIETETGSSFSNAELENLYANTKYSDPALSALKELSSLTVWSRLVPARPTVRIGDSKLFLGEPSETPTKIHPEYANVQLYPVWITQQLEERHTYRIEDRAVLIKSIDKMYPLNKALMYNNDESNPIPCTLQECEKYDIFVMKQSDFFQTYNVFSLLTQMPSQKPKKLIVGKVRDREDYKYSQGYIPLPFEFLLEIAKENLRLPAFPPPKLKFSDFNKKYSYYEPALFFEDMCYAELLILEYYTDNNDGDFDINCRTKPVLEWIEDKCGKKTHITIKNPQKRRFIFDPEMIDVAGELLVVREHPNHKNHHKKWVLVNPMQKAGDRIKGSQDATGAEKEKQKELDIFRANLEQIVKNSRYGGKGSGLTKQKLLALCREKGVTCFSSDKRGAIAQNLLYSLK